jgi:hypothetical protein
LKDKLKTILKFLKENREYNRTIQSSFFSQAFQNYNKVEKKEKVISLLYFVSQTQSQPRIKPLSISYQTFYNKINYKNFHKFCLSMGCSSVSYLDLFNKIKSDEFPGYGQKTSALFVRMIFQIHHIDEYKKYKIWDDVPELINSDKLFLPVDKVITEIFREISDKKWDFKKINNELQELFPNDMEVWDDLWFWGYFTQWVIPQKERRRFAWNEEKYWASRESDKEMIEKIQKKSKEFIKIIKN